MMEEMRERTGGEKKKRVEELRDETAITFGIQVSSITTGEILTSHDPFFSRAQPYA